MTEVKKFLLETGNYYLLALAIIGGVISLLTLGMAACEDYKTLKVSNSKLLMWGLGNLMGAIGQGRSTLFMLLGTLPGILIYVFSRFSKGQLGTGDGVVIMYGGLFTGIAGSLVLVFVTMAMTSCAGLFIKKKRRLRDIKMPYIPYYFIGYMMLWLSLYMDGN